MLAAGTLALSLAGCNDSTGPDPLTLAAAVRKWESKGPADYRFNYQATCFCGLVGLRPLTIWVQDGVVTHAFFAEGGEEVPPDQLGQVPTIDDLFAWIVEATNTGAHEITATYDDELGYPRQVFIDRIENAIDDELSFEVSNLRPLIVSG